MYTSDIGKEILVLFSIDCGYFDPMISAAMLESHFGRRSNLSILDIGFGTGEVQSTQTVTTFQTQIYPKWTV
eukprot:1340236-Amorphochlora_amoeboformis.AAC.1